MVKLVGGSVEEWERFRARHGGKWNGERADRFYYCITILLRRIKVERSRRRDEKKLLFGGGEGQR